MVQPSPRAPFGDAAAILPPPGPPQPSPLSMPLGPAPVPCPAWHLCVCREVGAACQVPALPGGTEPCLAVPGLTADLSLPLPARRAGLGRGLFLDLRVFSRPIPPLPRLSLPGVAGKFRSGRNWEPFPGWWLWRPGPSPPGAMELPHSHLASRIRAKADGTGRGALETMSVPWVSALHKLTFGANDREAGGRVGLYLHSPFCRAGSVLKNKLS